jgi:putative component of toxin-antitoxin plasmid stabilization module
VSVSENFRLKDKGTLKIPSLPRPVWKLEKTRTFEDKFKKLIPKNLQPKIKKLVQKISKNPYSSKPLGVSFLREKKIRKWRIYFLIYNDRCIIYFVDISDKKTQQKTIDIIKRRLKEFRKE